MIITTPWFIVDTPKLIVATHLVIVTIPIRLRRIKPKVAGNLHTARKSRKAQIESISQAKNMYIKNAQGLS